MPVRLEDARSDALRWGVVVLAAAALLVLAVLLLIGLQRSRFDRSLTARELEDDEKKRGRELPAPPLV